VEFFSDDFGLFSNSQIRLTHPTMTERPKRHAVTNREATDKLLDNRKRRSSAQVQQEKKMVATTAAALEEKKSDLTLQKKQRVAAFEDQLRKEDQHRDKNMARPDLVAAHHLVIFFLSESKSSH
jgi:hypothetical protein